jgi:hypothetical protein
MVLLFAAAAFVIAIEMCIPHPKHDKLGRGLGLTFLAVLFLVTFLLRLRGL